MESIKSKLKNKKFQKEEKKIDSWKLQAEEMSKYFKVPVYFLFWRYDRQKLYEAYRACIAEGKNSINYLIGILSKKP
jgi:hypothetical protein